MILTEMTKYSLVKYILETMLKIKLFFFLRFLRAHIKVLCVSPR